MIVKGFYMELSTFFKNTRSIFLVYLILFIQKSESQQLIIDNESNIDYEILNTSFNISLNNANLIKNTVSHQTGQNDTIDSFNWNNVIKNMIVPTQAISGIGCGLLSYKLLIPSNKKITPFVASGWFICTSIGISITGKLAYSEYNYFETIVGNIFGAILVFPFIKVTENGAGFYVLGGGIIGGLVGYHLSLSDIKAGGENLSINLFSTEKSYDYGNRMDIFKINYSF